MFTLSLPEVIFTLERARRQREIELLSSSRSRYLASGAKWSNDILALYNEFMGLLQGSVDPKPAVKATGKQLRGLFGALGIPFQN